MLISLSASAYMSSTSEKRKIGQLIEKFCAADEPLKVVQDLRNFPSVMLNKVLMIFFEVAVISKTPMVTSLRQSFVTSNS
ncbi:hypothetical protein D3C73_1037900 [compost metagenome]